MPETLKQLSTEALLELLIKSTTELSALMVIKANDIEVNMKRKEVQLIQAAILSRVEKDN